MQIFVQFYFRKDKKSAFCKQIGDFVRNKQKNRRLAEVSCLKYVHQTYLTICPWALKYTPFLMMYRCPALITLVVIVCAPV